MENIKNFNVRANKDGDILIEFDQINTDKEIENFLAVRFNIEKRDVVLTYDSQDENNDEKKIRIKDLALNTIFKIKNKKIINLMELAEENNIIYSAFSNGE